MKMARKVFEHPSGHFVTVEVTSGWWRKMKQSEVHWMPYQHHEVVEQVQAFCDDLGPQRVVNVCEYTTAKDRIGDDGRTVWVVWSWDAEPVAQ